jgi:chaperonin GroES
VLTTFTANTTDPRRPGPGKLSRDGRKNKHNQLFLKGVFMNLRPLHDRIVVKRLEQETKTASGIVIPDQAAEKPDQGEVVAIGNGKILEDGKVRPLDVKVGDKILFGKYSGQTVKVGNDEYLVMREEDVFAVVQ